MDKKSSLFLLWLLVVLAYANSLNNVFLSDDIWGIVQNKRLGDIGYVFSQPMSLIRPLVFYIAYKVGGLNPIFFRLVNLSFHLGSVWLLFLILFILVDQYFALVAASLFAVHPILVESVTWVSGGGYAQYTFFFLLSLFLYIRSKNEYRFYFFSLAAYLLCLLSGPPAVPLSSIFFLYELLFGSIKKNWLKVIPFFVGSLIFVLPIIFGGIGKRLEAETAYFYQEKQTLINPFIQIPIAITNYLQLIFWPDKLTLYHSELSYSIKEFIIRVILLLTFLLGIVLSYFKNKFVAFWTSLFFISLSVTLLPIAVAWIVAERYVYLGTIGIIAAAFYLVYQIANKFKARTALSILTVVIVVVLGIRTIIRNIDWKNEDNLWIATGKTSPSHHVTHNNLGDVYGRRGDFQRAIKEFKLAIKIKPNYADAYHNVGNTYRETGKIEEALYNYQKATEFNPYLWQSYQNIASIYFEQGVYASSEAYLKKAINVFPQNSYLYSNLGVIYFKMEKKNEAEVYYLKALEIDPNNQQARAGLLEATKR